MNSQDRGDTTHEYQKITLRMIFDVKVDGRRKAWLVTGSHLAEPLEDNAYSGVVSIDTIRLGFFAADLNELTAVAADVGNAYLYADTNEKVYTTAGEEFGDLQGRALIVRKALYGLRSSGA